MSWRTTLAAVIVLTVSAPLSLAQRRLIVSSQDHSFVTVDDCAHFHTHTSSSLPAQAQSEEQRAVPLAGVSSLKVSASAEGGVSVRGWDRPVGRVTICKYAVALTQQDADTISGGIRVDPAPMSSIGATFEHQWRDAGTRVATLMLTFIQRF